MDFVDAANYGDVAIKPCPFCGKVDALKLIDSTEVYPEDRDESFVMYQVVCDASTDACEAGCGACNGWQRSQAEAIINWNIRN